MEEETAKELAKVQKELKETKAALSEALEELKKYAPIVQPGPVIEPITASTST
jgi:hypothetical protein